MFESGELKINEAVADKVRELLQKNEEAIKSLLENADKYLGEGRTAKVCFCGDNNEVCVKIYKRPEEIIGVDIYLPPGEELEMMERLQKLSMEARIPLPLASFKSEADHDFIIMETLPAVSVDDVLQGRADLPESFDLRVFQKDLEDFVERMHEEGVYHRDLHEGNIMIDKATGKPYVIDFGAASKFYGRLDTLEPGETGPYHIRKDGKYIKLTSDEAMIRALIKKLTLNLTRTS